MLKLERVAKSGEIIMLFHGRTSAFSKLFYQALGLSLLVHLLAVCVFHIQPFILGPTKVFPPIIVQAPQLPFSSDIMLEAYDEKLAFEVREIFPAPMLLAFPALPSTWERPVRATGSFPFAFHDIDEQIYPVTHAASAVTVVYAPISLELGGSLAMRSLAIESGKQPANLLLAKGMLLNSFTVTYAVRVDERTGTVYWYERLASSGDETLDREAAGLLLDLKFVTIPENIDTEGQIRYVFKQPSHD